MSKSTCPKCGKAPITFITLGLSHTKRLRYSPVCCRGWYVTELDSYNYGLSYDDRQRQAAKAWNKQAGGLS